MENEIPPDSNIEERDSTAPVLETAQPLNESAVNAAAETGDTPDAEPEGRLANEGAAAVAYNTEPQAERDTFTLLGGTPPSPGPVEWKGLDVLFFLLFSAVWLVLSQFLSLAGYAVLRPLMGWRTPASDLARGDNAIFVVAAQLVFYAPVFLYIVLVVVLQYHQTFSVGIRWRWPNFRQGVRFLLAGVLLAMVVLAGSALLPDRKDFPMEKLFTSPSAVYAVGGLAVLIAPFMEELVFRGVLFSFFERLGGFRIAVPLTALLFAALHYPEYAGAWTHVSMILVVGLVLSVARAATRSLVPSFLLHTAYNATFIGLLFLGTHGFQNLRGIAGAP